MGQRKWVLRVKKSTSLTFTQAKYFLKIVKFTWSGFDKESIKKIFKMTFLRILNKNTNLYNLIWRYRNGT